MDQQEFSLMCEDNAKASSPFKATDLVWSNLTRVFRERMKKDGIRSVESQAFNASFASYPRSDRRYQRYSATLGDPNGTYDRACELYVRRLKEFDTHGILNKVLLSGVSRNSGMQTQVNDVWVTWDFLLSIEEVLTIIECEPRLLTEKLTVVDLGAGWGRIGHVLMSLNPNLSYVIADIPESLIIAQTYLPQHLPDVKHVLYSQNRSVESFTRDVLKPGEVRFCGSHDLSRFAESSIDVFINVFSFQEMTMTQVTEYVEIIDKVCKGGKLYSQQRLAGDVLTRENFPCKQDWSPLLDRLTIFSPAYYEAMFSVCHLTCSVRYPCTGSTSTMNGSSKRYHA